MNIIIEDTIAQYEKLFSLKENKEHFFRNNMMRPFEKMWNMINVPLKATQKSGFGGIPGFIQCSIYPNSYNIPRIPALIAHEFHHNIRFSYFEWDYGNVTVGDYLIIEGLAESFAKELYGEKMLGPWVTSFDQQDLEYSKEVIKDALYTKGFAEVSSYMFGDNIAKEQGYQPVGLSPFAGYAVGYQAVQSFMKMNNVGIEEATILDTNEILKNCGLFFT